MKLRILQGGAYYNIARDLRTSYRNWVRPEDSYSYYGFRFVAVRRKQWNGV